MKIQFLGTGAAEGVPAMFCSCEYCENIRKIGKSEFRTRTQVIIDGKISIDFPPEAFAHSLEYGVNLSKITRLFVTHSHMDHFYAHDFVLRGYKYAKFDETPLTIYGNSEVKAVFDECTAREMRGEVAKNIVFKQLAPFCTLEADGYRVCTLPANHKTKEQSLLYYMEREGKGYLHLYDTHVIGDNCFEFLKSLGAKVSLVAFDCTFADGKSNENSRHMGIWDDMQLKEKMLSCGIADENTKYVITHFSHNCNPLRSRLKQIEENFGVIAAYDGMEIEI